MPRLSVVIPTLNEADSLPRLLDALSRQSRPPDEVVVADAGSTDRTQELAREHGARVVSGGSPAAGRNAGARAATGDLLLFLDSDVLPSSGFLGSFLDAFEASGADLATCLIEPLSDRLVDRVAADATNLYLQVIQPLSPHAPGFCILIRRRLHERVGGFDETLKLAEDHDYVQRAARHGRFDVIADVRIPVSMRRLDREGLSRLAFKYLWCEMHALAGVPIRSVPFTYTFGDHAETEARRHAIVDITRLRRQLGRLGDPAAELSAATKDRLDRMIVQELLETRQALENIAVPDLQTLHRYLRRRRTLLRLTGRHARQRLLQLQGGPEREWLVLGDRKPRTPGGAPDEGPDS